MRPPTSCFVVDGITTLPPWRGTTSQLQPQPAPFTHRQHAPPHSAFRLPEQPQLAVVGHPPLGDAGALEVDVVGDDHEAEGGDGAFEAQDAERARARTTMRIQRRYCLGYRWSRCFADIHQVSVAMAFSTLTGLASRYSIVVDSDEWPRVCWMNRGATPRSCSHVAQVRRRL